MSEMPIKERLGFVLCGSFCTFVRAFAAMERLVKNYDITPIFSEHAAAFDTRFGRGADFVRRAEELCGKKAILTIPQAEPLGPKKLLDLLLVAPCTGNTLAKLANGITDTTACMAVKSHLRTERPVVLCLATNDALKGNAANIGVLLNRKHYYFVPFRQDDCVQKPASLVADFERIEDALKAAKSNQQLQPLFAGESLA